MKKLLLILPALFLLTGCTIPSIAEQPDMEIMNEAMTLQVSDIPVPEPEPEPEETVEPVDEVAEPAPEPAVEEVVESPVTHSCGSGNFRSDGVWYYGGYRFTWYSSRVLYHYMTDQWTPDEQGIYRDSDGYAVVASDDFPYGTVIEDTPFGAAKVYDRGCASGTIDVYVNF